MFLTLVPPVQNCKSDNVSPPAIPVLCRVEAILPCQPPLLAGLRGWSLDSNLFFLGLPLPSFRPEPNSCNYLFGSFILAHSSHMSQPDNHVWLGHICY